MEVIASRRHPVARAFRELAETPDADGARLLLDGVHQVRDARDAGAAVEVVAIAGERLLTPTEEASVARAIEGTGVPVFSVSGQVLAAISPVRTPSGIVAIARRTPVTPASIVGRANAFLLIAIDVQDPGNLGALVRVAEAGGVTGVLACGGTANPFSWKALRGSMGSALRLPVAHGLTGESAVACAKQSGARIVAAVSRGGRAPDAVEWSGRVALLIGGEGHGLPDAIVADCDERVTIPMTPPVESLNVAAAAAVLVYAARRQRR